MLLPLSGSLSPLGRSRASAAATEFDPTQLPGLQWGLDPDLANYSDLARTSLVTTDGSLVGGTTDPSGNARHALAVAANSSRPVLRTGANGINNKNVYQFSGAQQFQTPSFLDSSYNTALTVYLLSNTPGIGSLQLLLAAVTGANTLWFGRNASQLVHNYSGLSPTQRTYNVGTTAQVICECLVYNGSQAIVNIDGTETTATNTGNLGLTGALWVGRYGGGGFQFNGKARMIYVCNQAHDSDQRRQMMRYMLEDSGTAPLPRIVHDGDSLTVGQGVAGADSYPSQLNTLLGGASVWAVSNLGVGGQTVADMNADAVSQVDVLWDYYRSRNICAVWAGTNTIYLGGLGSGTTAYNDLVTYCAGRTAAGFSVSVSTMLPRTASGGYGGTETERQALNTALRADFTVATADPLVWLPGPGITYAACLIDVAAISAIGAPGAETDLTYYQSDQTHLKAAGYTLVAAPYYYAISNSYL